MSFDFLYRITETLPGFEEKYRHPEGGFVHQQEVLVLEIPATETDSAQAIEVYERRTPATFYKIVVKPSPSRDGYILSTGTIGPSTMAKLLTQLMTGDFAVQTPNQLRHQVARRA